MAIVLAALSLLGLGIFGPGVANGIVSGGPQLGAGAAIGTGLAAGGVVAAGAGLVTSGGGLAGGQSLEPPVAELRSPAARRPPSHWGAAGVATAGLSKGAEALASPLRRAAANLTSSFEAGGRAVTGEAAGVETGVAASASSSSADGPPAWARRMRRSQTISHGTSSATHAIKSGDGGGPARRSIFPRGIETHVPTTIGALWAHPRA